MQAMKGNTKTNNKIRKICVYCGSGPGTDPAFIKAAREFGKTLAENKIGLVYGGGAVGMMGEVARAVLEHGGDDDRHHSRNSWCSASTPSATSIT